MAEQPRILQPGMDTFEPLAEEVVLPSKGIFYNDKNRMLKDNGGKIKIKPMTFKEEQLLSSPRVVKTGQMVSTILEACVKTVGVDVENLLSTDRMFLFYYLRSISYGTKYTFNTECSVCRRPGSYDVDLSKIDIKYADPKTDKEPFEISLPAVKRKILLRFSRGIDESYQMEKIANNEQINIIDTLVRQIIDIEGIPQSQWYNFVENLNVKDAYILKNAFSGKESGIQTELSFKCNDCGKVFKTDLPLSVNFFRPE